MKKLTIRIIKVFPYSYCFCMFIYPWFMWSCLDVNLCNGSGVYARCVCTTSSPIKKQTRLIWYISIYLCMINRMQSKTIVFIIISIVQGCFYILRGCWSRNCRIWLIDMICLSGCLWKVVLVTDILLPI
jgi:hypothetical protein